MRFFCIFAGFFSAASLFAGNGGWNHGLETRFANIVSVSEDCDNVDLLPARHSTTGQVLPDKDIEMASSPSRYAPLWGNDLLVSNGWNLASRSKIAFDYGNDNCIYAAAIHATSTPTDSIVFLKSTDLGHTWTPFFALTNYADFLLMQDFSFRVDRNAVSNPNIYIALTDSNYTENQREMWFFILDQSSLNLIPVFFDPDTSSYFVSPTNVAMDITDDATPQIWITYNRITTAVGWTSVFSTDGGSSWAIQNHSASSGGGGCDVCVGPDDYVYITTVYTESNYALRMNRRQFSAYGDYLYVSPTTSEERYFPSVASHMEAAYGSNVVHVLYQTGSGSASRIKNSYSTDGGTNWALDNSWSPIGDVYAVRPFVRCGWNCDQFIGLAARMDTDSLATAWSSDQTWGSAAYVNDYQITGEITARGFVVDSTGRQVIYREFGSDNLWYDRYDMTLGVEEEVQGTAQIMKISVKGKNIEINFSLNAEQKVRIDLYDVTGRNVLNICDRVFPQGEHHLDYEMGYLSGPYIVNFSRGSLTTSEKIILF
ncbi:hypothetical protein JXA84_03220 [candidate division WOR-3 bacterium]|nr:hypothetical protein [candidate division WOR-3 bacterium]